MKKQFFLPALLVLLSGLVTAGFAQDVRTAKKPAWVPDNGYWVVESNIHTPKNSTLYFYNLDNVLVYKETIRGIKIKLQKKRVLKNLKNVLEQSLAAWEARHVAGENKMLVALALKN